LELSLIEIENRLSKESFIAEEGGRPLQYVYPPFVIRMEPPEPWPLVVNRLLFYWARFRWRQTCRRWTLPTWQNDSPDQEMSCENYHVRKLPLIHPRAVALSQNDTRFTIRRHSVFNPIETPCHVIRTMNILNRAYFSEQELAAGARNVLNSLQTGGIWIVGRTIQDDPPVHNVSIFRKQYSGVFELIQHIGEGSEIDSIALESTGTPAPVGLKAFA
jgi:hypothetical protein